MEIFLCISKTLGNALSSIENLSKALRPSGNLHKMLDPNEKMGEGFRSQWQPSEDWRFPLEPIVGFSLHWETGEGQRLGETFEKGFDPMRRSRWIKPQ